MSDRRRRLFVRLAFCVVLVGYPDGLAAQDAAAPDTAQARRWNIDLVSKLAASQSSFHNWTEGGTNTLALAGGLEGKAVKHFDSWEHRHEIRLALGLIKHDTLEIRKADDVIRLNSSLQYRGDDFFMTFNPTLAAAIQTQFIAGFNYKKDPFEEGRPPPIKISDFFAPAIFTQSAGLTYTPVAWFNQRLGIGGKQTVVAIERLRSLYNINSGKLVRFEMGIESRTEVDREIVENVRLRSRLGLFAAFNKSDLPDLIWENLVAMKVNAWLAVNFELTALYDSDLSRRIQMKEVLSLGFSFDIL
jgi:hypothetical protein